MLNKVPEVTIFFWIIKILATTVGETAADFLNTNLNFGLTGTTYVMGSLLLVALFFQFRARKYVPGIYWLAVVLISVVGTLITDNLIDNFGVALETTTIVFSIALAATFAAWYASEKTLSIHTIYTTRREAFYWLTILFTFALGTAAGDLAAERLALGYFVSALIFGATDRGRVRRPRPLQAERGPGLLDRLHPDPSARRLARRPPVTGSGRRWSRSGHDRDQRALPRHDPRPGHLPDDHEQGRDCCPRATTA